MAGELWRSVFAIGLESTPGTAVAATRKQYYMPDSNLSISRDAHVHRYATGTRDNVRAYTNGPIQAGGSITIAASADESLELFSMGVSGSPVITTPSGATNTRLHTYKPADLASATLEWNDGKRVWQGAGMRINTLTVAGADNGDFTLAGDLFGTTVVSGTATTGLTDRTPTILEGWQSRIYVDAFTGTPGTTVVTGFMTNWSVSINNNLGRVYTSDNTLNANRVIAGELDITASITVDADSAQAITEFNNWSTAVGRMVRLEFQDETGFIEGAFRRFIRIDIPGNWTAVNLGASGDGIRHYELSFQSVYQSTLAAMVQVQVQCPRTQAFS